MEKIKISGFYRRWSQISLLLVFAVIKGNAQVTASQIPAAELISKLKLVKDRPLPYGPAFIGQNKNATTPLIKKVGEMNANLFADYEDPRRMKLRVTRSLQRLLLKSGANVDKIIKVYQGPVEFRVVRLAKGALFDLYSLMASEQLDCNNCEYGFSQTVNVLVTISKDRIVDHMTGAFNSGNDLSLDHRYLYLDDLKKIYTLDLSTDEETTSLGNLQTWSIDSSGRFIRNSKK